MSTWRRSLLLALALASCAQQQSCGCLGTLQPLPSPLADSDQTQNGATLYVSPAGFDVLTENFPTLVSQFLPNGLVLSVPPSNVQTGCIGTFCAINEQICAVANCPYADAQRCAGGCPVEATIDGVQLERVTPNQLDATLLVTVDSSAFGLDQSGACVAAGSGGTCANQIWVSGFPLSCTVDLALDRSPIAVPLSLTFDPVSEALTLVPGAATSALTGSDFSFACGLGGQILNLLRGLIAQQLNAQLEKAIGGQLQGTFDGLQCMAPGFYASAGACPPGSFEGTNAAGQPTCARDDDGGCVTRPSGVVGVGDLSSALAAFGAPPARADLAIFPGQAPGLSGPVLVAGADGGLTLPLVTGAVAAAPSTCVPPLGTRSYATPADIDFLRESARAGVRSFDLAFGLSQPFFQRLADQAYAAGAFCLEIGASQGLTTSALGALFPSLTSLLPDEPVTLVFRPQAPPVIALGQGTVQNGQPQDPLILLTLPGVRIDALAALDGRDVRVFAFTADLVVPLALIPANGGSSMQLVLGAPGQFLGNIQGEASDLLDVTAATTTAQLQKFLPVALGLAASGLGALPPIALPAVVGFAPTVEAVSGIVPAADGGYQDLGLFLGLAPASAPDGGALADGGSFAGGRPIGADPLAATLVGSQLPTLAEVGPGGTLPGWPTEFFALGNGSAAVEASYRIDRGPWSVWLRGSALAVADPRLLLEATHQIDVRVRSQGDRGAGALSTVEVAIALPATVVAPGAVIAVGTNGPPVALAALAEGRGCATGAGSAAWLTLAVAALGLRRRRR